MRESEYKKWILSIKNEEERALLKGMTKTEIEESFSRDLQFGTGGLRATMGMGSSKMNRHTVKRATQGVADYLKAEYKEKITVVIGYDSRHHSFEFARVAAAAFAEAGIFVYIFRELLPTPILSFAVRALGCNAGVMITASHNPSEYNGYKVYGADGCQITDTVAKKIAERISCVEFFSGKEDYAPEDLFSTGKIAYVPDSVYGEYLTEVEKLSILGELKTDIKIVYSPLCGTGRVPVCDIFRRKGYRSVTLVSEQELPNGDFPTCESPNPELSEAMMLGTEYAKRNKADIFIATDPDCDRVGVVAADKCGNYHHLTGNEVGLLLCEYVCSLRIKNHTLPDSAEGVKTIVTSELARKVLESYGVKVTDVLTGFKYIGEYLGTLEGRGIADRFIIGFEESCGYLFGSYVRDKDGVAAALLIAEMTAYHKSSGKTLIDALEQIYLKYGYEKTCLKSYSLYGREGLEKIREVMRATRAIRKLCDYQIDEVKDYSYGIDGLPKSDVVKFFINDVGSVTVRPSGTEPKLKVYLCVSSEKREHLDSIITELLSDFEKNVGLG